MLIRDVEEAQKWVGRQVAYRAGYPGAPEEYGVVTSVNELYIFVRFGNYGCSQACAPRDLRLVWE